MHYFQNHKSILIGALLVNNPHSFALKRAEKYAVPAYYFSRKEFSLPSGPLLECLKSHGISYILLAGFLQLIPAGLLKEYPDRILNIHPALLPAFGGPGMYGHRVHEAVKASGATSSGMTIHLVNEHYDEGKKIFQATCKVDINDSADDIAARVLKLEHIHYSLVAEYFIHNSTDNQRNKS